MRKIYDFNVTTIPSGIVGRPREIAWPCKVFTRAQPIVKGDGYKDTNPFERCVLRLLSLRAYTPSELAEETCLPPDLIAVILLRLFDRGKIDQNYHLTSDAMAELENRNQNSTIEYRTIYQFVDCLSNKELAAVSGPLKAEEINDDGSIRNGADSIFLHYLSKEKHFAIEPDAEFCLLRVRMILQKNGDWRILNPFGNGWAKWSKILEPSYLQFLKKNSEEAEAFAHWQESNSKRVQMRKLDRMQEPYDTEENRIRYPQLIAALNRRDYYSGESDIDVYASLEWAFFYSLKEVELKEIVQLLTIDSIQNNEARLAVSASNIFDKNMQYSDLRKARVFLPMLERIKGFHKTEKAEMQVVLPLAILAENQLPLRLVAAQYPDFLSRISDLNSRRNTKMHGKSRWTSVYGKVDIEFMQNVITILLPSIFFSDFQTTQPDTDTVFDIRFNARRSLQDFFGVAQFNSMDSVLQENLIQVELFLQFGSERNNEEERIDALRCITNLYSAAECAFRPLIEKNHEIFSSFNAITEKVQLAGLGELPVALKTVRSDLLQKTLDGNDQTLGACLVVWLLRTGIEELKQIAIKMPAFLATMSQLLTLREHGNQICMLQKSELKQLCKSTYKVIDIIKED